jgi:hypothetical protein
MGKRRSAWVLYRFLEVNRCNTAHWLNLMTYSGDEEYYLGYVKVYADLYQRYLNELLQEVGLK